MRGSVSFPGVLSIDVMNFGSGIFPNAQPVLFSFLPAPFIVSYYLTSSKAVLLCGQKV